MSSKTFKVTEEHIKLLRRMYARWYDGEFGAPGVDCKRPYGNGDGYGDIAEILGIEKAEDKDFTPAQFARMEKLHPEMETVLQILLTVGELPTGEYRKHDYMSLTWKKV